MLAIYLLALAAFLLFLNAKAGSRTTKFISYYGMWIALAGSAFVALTSLPVAL